MASLLTSLNRRVRGEIPQRTQRRVGCRRLCLKDWAGGRWIRGVEPGVPDGIFLTSLNRRVRGEIPQRTQRRAGWSRECMTAEVGGRWIRGVVLEGVDGIL